MLDTYKSLVKDKEPGDGEFDDAIASILGRLLHCSATKESHRDTD